MTGCDPEPTPSRELLADLDAGLLDPAVAAEVRAAAVRDPRAGAELAGLAATRAELGALADPPVPGEYAARWDAALDAEAGAAARPADAAVNTAADTAVISRAVTGGGAGTDTTVDEGTAATPRSPAHNPARRSRRPAGGLAGRRPLAVRRRLALGVTAALAAAAVAGVMWTTRSPDLPSLDGVDLVAAGRSAVGTTEAGDLADPGRRAACLRAVAPPGVEADAALLGGRQVTLQGQPAVLLVLAGGGPRPGIDIVVVDPGCGPGGGTLLGRQSAGG